MLMYWLAKTSHIGLLDIIPPRVPASFSHILMRTPLRAKGLVGTRGGGGGVGGGNDVLKIFSISYMYNTKSDHFSPKIKPYIYANRKPNAKS